MISIDQTVLHSENNILLSYSGTFTQSLIAGMTGVLEKEIEAVELPMKISNNIYVVFIELAQNVMNYAKKTDPQDKLDPKGSISVGREENNYIVCSYNIITQDDKQKIVPLLEFIHNSSQEEIKQKYKEVRRSKRNSEEKGSGLGLLEVAKKAQRVEYSFKEAKNNMLYFKLCVVI